MSDPIDDDALSDALGMRKPFRDLEILDPSIDYTSAAPKNVPITPEDEYAYAKNRSIEAIDIGSQALREVAQLAAQANDPDSYEVVSKMLKAVTDATRNLIEMRRTDKQTIHDSATSSSITNNNLFVGTTAELLDIIKGSSKPPKIEEEIEED